MEQRKEVAAEVKRLMRGINWPRQCGRNVIDRRQALGFTQQQLANLTGITQAAISAIEIGERIPRDYIKVAIALALMTEVDLLWPPLTRAKVEELRRAAEAIGAA